MSKQTHSSNIGNNLSQGTRAQLKQTLTSIMVIQTKLNHRHLMSVWLVISEAGDAVCEVV